MEIKPTHAIFEHAKWLKELGFIEFCNMRYNEFGKLTATKLGMHANPNNYVDSYSAPEQWQVVEWLRVNHGIWINVTISQEDKWEYFIGNTINCDVLHYCSKFNSPQEAYSAAFDYIRNNNLI
jgi:hypothetical protein